MLDIEPFDLIPATEDALTPDDEIASIVYPDELQDTPDPGPQSFGMTWQFDFEEGRTVRYGNAPATATDVAAAIMICQVALRTRRGDLPIFDEDFGMDDPDRLIGRGNLAERLAEYESDIRDTLLAAHERIVDVRDFQFDHDPDDDDAEHSCVVVFDDDSNITLTFPTITD